MKRSKILLGMMRLNPVSVNDLEEIIAFCLENGINSFDLSDVYCRHESEIKFGEVMKMRNPEDRKNRQCHLYGLEQGAYSFVFERFPKPDEPRLSGFLSPPPRRHLHGQS